jgi:hypothetical protein
MNGALVGFLVAVGAMSTFIFALSRRLEKRRAGWGPSRRRIVPSDGDGGLSSGSDSWSFASWFGGSETFSSGHSGHDGASCSTSGSGAGGSWDSGGGGGGDCGGGGGDGGGGGGGGD